MLRIAFQDVKTVGIRNKPISKLYQHFRERDFPYGLQNALCTLALQYCSRLTPLRSRTNTRYGRAANPYPTGTCTPQKTPSFARRDNVQLKAARAPADLAGWHAGFGARSLLKRRLGFRLPTTWPTATAPHTLAAHRDLAGSPGREPIPLPTGFRLQRNADCLSGNRLPSPPGFPCREAPFYFALRYPIL